MDIKNESIVPCVPKQGYKSRHTKSSTKIWNDNITKEFLPRKHNVAAKTFVFFILPQTEKIPTVIHNATIQPRQ